MSANKPSDTIPEVMKRRIKELERDGYNEDFLRCFRNAIRELERLAEEQAHSGTVERRLEEYIGYLAEVIQPMKEVLRISDRKHDAWDAAKAAIAKVDGTTVSASDGVQK